MTRRIRLLLVEDSPVALEIIKRMIATAPDIEVVGTAANGVEALQKLPALKPDVICTDFHMPRMDGLRLIHEVMSSTPVPILVMSTSLQSEQKQNIFEMLEAGAVDVLAKPMGGLQLEFGAMAQDLIEKIRVLSGVKVFRRRPAGAIGASRQSPATAAADAGQAAPRIVGIGASTGGPQALECILRALPPQFPLPVLCIQHIAQGFIPGLVNWLSGGCQIRVVTAQTGLRPEPGTAYFAADDQHLEIDDNGMLRCSRLLPVRGHRPSVDVALNSLARHYGAGALGVLLTGMGGDGAEGLLSIRRAGGMTIAQDEDSSVIFGMPKRAIDLGAACRVLPLQDIAPALIEATTPRSP